MSIENFVYYIFYTILYDIFISAEALFSDVTTNSAYILSNEFYSFSFSVSKYNIFIPEIIVVVFSITAIGLYFIFIIISGASEVLP